MRKRRRKARQKSIQRENPQSSAVDFTALISDYALSASAHLGQLRTSETDDREIDLGMARRMIDTIKLLKEKTRGNLTDSEEEFLERVLHNLKMSYVRAAHNPQPATKPGDPETKPRLTASNATASFDS